MDRFALTSMISFQNNLLSLLFFNVINKTPDSRRSTASAADWGEFCASRFCFQGQSYMVVKSDCALLCTSSAFQHCSISSQIFVNDRQLHGHVFIHLCIWDVWCISDLIQFCFCRNKIFKESHSDPELKMKRTIAATNDYFCSHLIYHFFFLLVFIFSQLIWTFVQDYLNKAFIWSILFQIYTWKSHGILNHNLSLMQCLS